MKPSYQLFLESVYTEESVTAFLNVLTAIQELPAYKGNSVEANVVWMLQNEKLMSLMEKK